MRWSPRVLPLLVAVLLFPGIALAQATLAGVVRETSGAVLPGVTVEVSSPALTERVRSVVTDGTGQYRIVTLPPGTYVIKFSLAGFTTAQRDGVTVSGSGVIPINVDMAVGAVTETITVSGESPLVDTQTTRRETVINSETINALPITRNYGGVLYATPGLTVQPGVNNNALMPGMSLFSANGGISSEGRVFVNGVSVNGPFGQNSVTQFAFDVANAEEMQVLVGGGLGESETGGPVANIVPKSGTNTFSGSAFFSGTQSRLQSNNVDDALRAQGIPAPPTVRKNWDTNAALGGPIVKDRLWFFGNVRSVAIAQVVSGGVAQNLYQGDASQWLYAPQPGIETRFVESKMDVSARLTGQLTKRNRVSFSHQPQYRCLGSTLTSGADGCRVRGDSWIGAPATSETTAPEAGSGYQDAPSTLTQATWSSPLSSRHLVDAAVSRFSYGIIGNGSTPPDAPLGLIGVTETSDRYGRPNTSYRAPYGWGEYDTVSWNWRAAWAYVTGSHSAKVGYQGTVMKYDWESLTNPALMRYTFTNGVPVSVSYTGTSQWDNANRAVGHSFFLQDQWTRGRLTLQGGLRYDRVTSWAPDGGNGTDQVTALSPTPIRFGRMDSVTGFNDLTPRVGVAYDLFGNGRTAVKASIGKYLAAATADGIYSSQNQGLNYVRTASRSWTDTNGNRVVDCDLLNPALQTSGGDTCLAPTGANLNFGNLNPNTTQVDPEILSGWGVRPFNWNFTTSIQHQVRSGLSVDVGYSRRNWGNYFVTYNQLVGPSDYDVWSVPVPVNANLPNAGGTESYVAITPAAAARGSQSFQTKEENIAGETRTAYYQGFDVSGTSTLR